MLDNLEALSPLMNGLVEAEAIAKRLRPGGDAFAGLSLNRSAADRAARFFHERISDHDADIEGAGTAFIMAWSFAEREVFRRVVAAVTSPGAKGREAEIIAALANGASVTEALACAAKPQEPLTNIGNVVTLTPRGVTRGKEHPG